MAHQQDGFIGANVSELLMAVSVGDLNKVEMLLSDKNYANENINHLVAERDDEPAVCALHLAVEGGFLEIVKLLLKNKARTDILDGEGYTPLHIACNIGHIDILKVLLEYDANPEAVHEKSGSTSLQEAVCTGAL